MAQDINSHKGCYFHLLLGSRNVENGFSFVLLGSLNPKVSCGYSSLEEASGPCPFGVCGKEAGMALDECKKHACTLDLKPLLHSHMSAMIFSTLIRPGDYLDPKCSLLIQCKHWERLPDDQGEKAIVQLSFQISEGIAHGI